MELTNSPKPGNGPDRFAGLNPKTPEGVAEVRDRLAQVREVSAGELDAARERIERVKADAAERALRMGAGGTDSIELSSAASALMSSDESEAAHTQLVTELKAAYESGTVNTQSRIERAASRLLGGE